MEAIEHAERLKRNLNVSIPDELREQLEQRAMRPGVNLSGVVTRVLARGLEKQA